jgi:hypothetical protein
MPSLIKTSVIFLVIVSAIIIEAAEPGNNPDDFLTVAQQMHEEWKQLKSEKKSLSDAEARALRERAAQWSKQSPSSVAVANYLVVRFTMTETQQDTERRQIISSLPISMLPEGICLLISRERDKEEKEWKWKQCLADLCPLSSWQRGRNNHDTSWNWPDYEHPTVPGFNDLGMQRLATSFETVGLWDLAWRAYADFIYSNHAPPWGGDTVTETYISPTTGYLWIKIAECAYKADKKDIAMDYLMKAAVFGNDDLLKIVKEKVFLLSVNPVADVKQNYVDEKIKSQELKRVILLYTRLIAHPRAFQVMDEYPDAFGDSLDKLRKQTENDWLVVVKNSAQFAKKVVYYGQEVHPMGNPLKVRIPWTFSDEVVISVRNKLKEPLSKQK